MTTLKRSGVVESLRVALTSNSLDWVQQFSGDRGLQLLLGVIRECLTRYRTSRLRLYSVEEPRDSN